MHPSAINNIVKKPAVFTSADVFSVQHPEVREEMLQFQDRQTENSQTKTETTSCSHHLLYIIAKEY